MGNDDVIEFNGKRYDAWTGKVIGKSRSEVVEPLAPSITPVKRRVDGFGRRRDAINEAPTRSESAPVPTAKQQQVIRRQAGSVAKAHQPQAPKTLMRRAVHKPKTDMKPAIKPQAPAEVMAKPVSAIALKHSVHQVNPHREDRARKTPKSRAVQRFATHIERPMLGVEVAPKQHRSIPKSTSAQQYTKPDIFEAAIAHAQSHEQPHHEPAGKRRRHRSVGVFVGLLLALTIGSVLGYVNLSNIRVKVASVQAGFDAQLPSYQPTGYVLGAVTTSSGNVTLSFRSGEKQYKLTQQPSDWNSQTLNDSLIASAGAKTIESKGRIIYIYDDVASWVSGGVRYDLTGNAELDPDEVAAIAASL